MLWVVVRYVKYFLKSIRSSTFPISRLRFILPISKLIEGLLNPCCDPAVASMWNRVRTLVMMMMEVAIRKNDKLSQETHSAEGALIFRSEALGRN